MIGIKIGCWRYNTREINHSNKNCIIMRIEQDRVILDEVGEEKIEKNRP